jgi:hypothetical protein
MGHYGRFIHSISLNVTCRRRLSIIADNVGFGPVDYCRKLAGEWGIMDVLFILSLWMWLVYPLASWRSQGDSHHPSRALCTSFPIFLIFIIIHVIATDDVIVCPMLRDQPWIDGPYDISLGIFETWIPDFEFLWWFSGEPGRISPIPGRIIEVESDLVVGAWNLTGE